MISSIPKYLLFILSTFGLIINTALADDYDYSAYVDLDNSICVVLNGDLDGTVIVDEARITTTQDTTTGDIKLQCAGLIDPPTNGKTAIYQGFACDATSLLFGDMTTTDTQEVVNIKGKAKMSCRFQRDEPVCQEYGWFHCPPTSDPQSYIDGLFVQLNGFLVNYEPPLKCSSIEKVTWDWGDGVIEEFLPMPGGYVFPFPSSHTYIYAGSYDVILKIFDPEDNLLDSDICSVYVH